MDLTIAKNGFLDELTKIASELTPAGRDHVAPKNFAVSAKASNTGKPAYPIEDKAHAKAALGLSAMHGDAKDVSEVRKDVARKFPGMVKEKKAAGGLSPEEVALQEAWQQHQSGLTGGQKLRHGLSMVGGATTGGGLGAGLGYLGSKGVNALAGREMVSPGGAAGVGGYMGGLAGLLGGSIVGDVHGQADVNAGKSLEKYIAKEDKIYGPGKGGAGMAKSLQDPASKKKSASIDVRVLKAASAIVKEAFSGSGALRAGLGEFGPAVGATAGAALAGGLGKNPLSGAAMGYGVGSIPEMLLSKGKKHAA